MTACRWHRQQQRTMMSRQGFESVHGDTRILAELASDKPKRRRLTKEELRRQAEEAIAAFTGAITKLPAGKRGQP